MRHAWFRFRRAVEDTPTVLLVLEQEPNAKTCASLVLQLAAEVGRWTSTDADPSAHAILNRSPCRNPSARLLDGATIRMQVLRSRVQPASDMRIGRFDSEAADAAPTFHTKTIWSRG